ncbi:phage terminase small subunit P27 family [Antarctobacter jejuensis]|uniref:phage terminase small subunit P27 family n=1 Tax=Antarctobacter jejuensis TaxID=1439938 RepID=UPI003FD27A43
MFEAGLLTLADRAALAAYCQAYARWAEAEERLKDTPALLKTPSGYVQQSPWLTVANKQMELMGRFMSELGLTPVARTRIQPTPENQGREPITFVWRTIVNPEDDTGDAPTEHVKRLPRPGNDG